MANGSGADIDGNGSVQWSVKTKKDENHCGACFAACPPGDKCKGGKCK